MLRQYNLTLDGTAQPLSDALPTQLIRDNPAFREVFLQADDGASAAMFIGDADVTAAVHGIRIAAPAAGVPDRPIALGPYTSGAIHLNEIYVIGTADDILNIVGVEW